MHSSLEEEQERVFYKETNENSWFKFFFFFLFHDEIKKKIERNRTELKRRELIKQSSKSNRLQHH